MTTREQDPHRIVGGGARLVALTLVGGAVAGFAAWTATSPDPADATATESTTAGTTGTTTGSTASTGSTTSSSTTQLSQGTGTAQATTSGS